MDPTDDVRTLAHQEITAEGLPEIRAIVTNLAVEAGLDDDRAAQFAFAVHEVAANTVDHAEGTGELTVIQDDQTMLYAHVSDHGPGIAPGSPVKPPAGALRGRGMWLSNELTDQMHVDSAPDETVVHLQMALGDPAATDADPDVSTKDT